MKTRFYILIMCLSLFPILAFATDDERRAIFTQFDHDDLMSLYNQMAIYHKNFQYDKEIEIGEKILSLYSEETSNAYVLFTYCKLADCYKRKHDYNHALDLLLKAHDFYLSGSINRPNMEDVLSKDIGDCYFGLGMYEEAIRYYDEVVDASLLADIAVNFLKINDDDKATNYAANAVISYRNQHYYLFDNDKKTSNASLDAILAIIYYHQGDSSLAYSKMRLALEAERQHLLRALRLLPANDRADYWNKFSTIFLSVFPSIAYGSNNPLAAGHLYDMSALFAKGMLLSADTEFDRLLHEMDDPFATEKQEQLLDTREQIKRMHERRNTINGDTVQLNQLQQLQKQAEELEYELLSLLWYNVDSIGDYTQSLKFSWRDVREKLNDNDIAVEFLSFPKLGTDSTLYIALALKNHGRPQLVFICEESELKAAAKRAYTSNELSQLIWGKLSKELKGVKNIYFSPSGELHTVAIESIPHWEKTDSLMNQCYNIYRLSSTREIVISRDRTLSQEASVYGDIAYDAPVESMGSPREANDLAFLVTSERGFDADSAGLRGYQWRDLKYTRAEVDSIAVILGSQEIKVDTRTVDDATETSFKNLNGKRKSIIHIATHGFCWNESTASEFSMKNQLSFMTGQSGEDKAMTRTGLLFSGAQHCFNESGDSTDVIPEGVDDGVLTAKEVSIIDLRGLDLLVLSACQTGLGEVSGEGVFGLQRGFKKAGAQTIIMSLWSVDDKATCEMMTQFYRAYASGMTKQEAFLEAQKHIKDTYGNYKDKEHTIPIDLPHWAAFIILDALDNK